jgi:hypothetical protein
MQHAGGFAESADTERPPVVVRGQYLVIFHITSRASIVDVQPIGSTVNPSWARGAIHVNMNLKI